MVLPIENVIIGFVCQKSTLAITGSGFNSFFVFIIYVNSSRAIFVGRSRVRLHDFTKDMIRTPDLHFLLIFQLVLQFFPHILKFFLIDFTISITSFYYFQGGLFFGYHI